MNFLHSVNAVFRKQKWRGSCFKYSYILTSTLNQEKHRMAHSCKGVCVFGHSGFSHDQTTVTTLWTVTHQPPLSLRFSRQEYWSGLLCPPPGDLPDPGIKPRSPALQADSLPLSHRGSPYMYISSVQSLSRVRLFATP